MREIGSEKASPTFPDVSDDLAAAAAAALRGAFLRTVASARSVGLALDPDNGKDKDLSHAVA